jgi:hypothetical protein
MAKIATGLFALVLVAHGLLHLIGFARARGWMASPPSGTSVAAWVGWIWLLAAVLFGAAAAGMALAPRWWWMTATAAVAISQLLIIAFWTEARWGSLVNLGILVPVLAAGLGQSRFGYQSVFQREVEPGLRRAAATPLVTEADLAPLPAPVQRYLSFVGVVGRPRVQNLRATFRGQMRSSPTAPWIEIEAEQYSFFDQPSRLFLMRASLRGLPFEALHTYVGPAATMRVKVASLVKVVDARGPEMNQSETVTMFNDMCLLAPATLIEPTIRWEPIDDRTVRASFSNAGNVIRATLSFAADGALTNFVSEDRYQSSDGKVYRRLPWSTPVRAHREFHGFQIAADAEASWQQPDGPLIYARFELVELSYNVPSGFPKNPRSFAASVPVRLDPVASLSRQ